MQVNRISHNPSFGFNEGLNAKVIKKLETQKNSKAYFNTLLKINEITNETEMLLRKAESIKNKSLVGKLEDVFIMMKSYFASSIDYRFPKLNYSMIEAGTYATELAERQVKDVNHWGYNIIRILTERAEGIENEGLPEVRLKDKDGITIKRMSMEELPDEIRSQIEEQVNNIEAAMGQGQDTDILQAGRDLVETYVPTKFTEKGFEGLGGMKELKAMLTERIVEPLRNREQAKIDELEYGIRMPKNILLYGPPGCGKTTIVECLSQEAGVPLLKMKSGKYGTSYYHQTSENIEAIFDYAESIATAEKPVIVFIDDADSTLASRSDRMERFESEELTTLLDRIQSAGDKNVIVISATNRFDMMDEAVRSRYEEKFEVTLPDLEARISILELYLKNLIKGQELANNKEAIKSIAEKYEGFPIRAISMHVAKASVAAKRDGRRNITAEDFYKIIQENQNDKINQNLYKTNQTRRSVGF